MWKELANFSDNMDTVFGVPSSTISYGGGSNVLGAYRTTTVHGPLLMEKLSMMDPERKEFEYYIADGNIGECDNKRRIRVVGVACRACAHQETNQALTFSL